MRIQHKKPTKNGIKPKNYPKKENTEGDRKTWDVYCYKAKCTMQWAEAHNRKMSVDSIQNWPPQLTLKLSLVILVFDLRCTWLQTTHWSPCIKYLQHRLSPRLRVCCTGWGTPKVQAVCVQYRLREALCSASISLYCQLVLHTLSP